MTHPLLRGLLVQVLATLAALGLLTLLAGGQAGMMKTALLQGGLAALGSRLFRQPAWWVAIHLLFMPMVAAALLLNWPSEVYLAGLVLLALVFWGTVKGDVPLFLSSPAVTDTLQQIVQQEKASRLVDLGAGIGSVTVPLAQRMPPLMVESWERAPIPWAILALRARRLNNLAVYRGSFWHCDLSVFDVVFAFLSPAVMPRLGEKILREMPPGSLFVSSSFPVPDWQPESVLALDDTMGTHLYCYRIAGERT